jgi:hypothetical protein
MPEPSQYRIKKEPTETSQTPEENFIDNFFDTVRDGLKMVEPRNAK